LTVRLQKFLADAGVASRRACEQIILEGRVRVNGEPVRQLGTKIDPDREEVALDGKAVRARRKLYLALHKPRGCVSPKDGHGRQRFLICCPRSGKTFTRRAGWTRQRGIAFSDQ
jgi:23S rRNA pseudouridine2605 synthase